MRRPLLLTVTALLAACVADVSHRKPSVRMPVPDNQTAVAPTVSQRSFLLGELRAAAPHAAPNVLNLALTSRTCAIHRGAATLESRLAVIDYSRPSTERRLWV